MLKRTDMKEVEMIMHMHTDTERKGKHPRDKHVLL